MANPAHKAAALTWALTSTRWLNWMTLEKKADSVRFRSTFRGNGHFLLFYASRSRGFDLRARCASNISHDGPAINLNCLAGNDF
jgi:hypothetical protein